MISSLGYLRFSSADVGTWREFGVKVLGMTEGRGPEKEAVYLRMDEMPARLVIVPGSSEKLLASGWEVRDAAALAAVGRALSEAGVPYKAATDSELALRRVGAMIKTEDPHGQPLEVFCGAALEHRPAVSPYGNRFVTGDMGLGHVVLPVPPGSTAAFDFYTEVLGFRLRDSMRMPAEFFGGKPGDPPVWFRFLGCNARHHSLALAPVPAPAGIVHLMVETASLDDVGLALDRCARKGAHVSGTLGRHANDLMVSFYVRTPGGFDVEYGTDGLQVDDASWITRETTAVSLWGHNFAGPVAH
jgi:3,4-dihydroxy-9,10-secoandrosta-1,3,5(10)-triene-9,17-dione 4,5-dioxygenase